MATFITKGTVVTDPSANDIGRAQFVRLIATAQATVTVKEDGGAVTLGEVFLYAAGDEAIIEKAPGDEITASGVKAHAVGSPRS